MKSLPALAVQPVDVRRFQERVAGEPEVAGAGVIDEDDEEVGLALLRQGYEGCRHQGDGSSENKRAEVHGV